MSTHLATLTGLRLKCRMSRLSVYAEAAEAELWWSLQTWFSTVSLAQVLSNEYPRPGVVSLADRRDGIRATG